MNLVVTSGIVFISIFALTKGQTNTVHDVRQLIDAQIDFLENTVNLVGHVVANVSLFIEKTFKGNKSKEVLDRIDYLQEKVDAIKLRNHYLLHQKNNLLKSMVNHLFPGFEFNFTVDKDYLIAAELTQHVTECRYVLLNWLPNAFLELANDTNLAFDEKDDEVFIWEQMTGIPKRRFEHSILKWSEEYGLKIPFFFHKVANASITTIINETIY